MKELPGLVQVLSDNFDATISSQNGLRSTHSLAVPLTMPDTHDTTADYGTIKRVTTDEMKQAVTVVDGVPVPRFNSPKKPQMPPEEATRAVLPLHVLPLHQAPQLSRAHVLDFDFLKRVITEPNTPEFGGFKTELSREQGQSAQPATRAIYTPLIDMTPADSDTMMTAMVQAQKLTKECGQEITIFTNDQQLYKVAVFVTWVYQERFSLLIPRLGGMHLLMSFIGSVGGGGADDRQWLRRNSKFQLWWCAQHACRETIAAELPSPENSS